MQSLLKFITCGSVDDGKSTLIGHLLYDSKLLYTDQEEALELDSKAGSREGQIDYSLLLDGLTAEREQGITIDVAYRYFTTDKRSFIVADTPGHEEYTRNMAVGASFADLAVILIDASRGVLIQTKRHSRICALMGIRHFVFAVNKMDLVDYSESAYKRIEKEIRDVSNNLSLEHSVVIPVSATEGDNITKRSHSTSWYQGPVLLDYLETVDVIQRSAEKGFYLPVQRVCRPNHTFRGFQGQAESGVVHVGDEVISYPSNETARVKSLLLGDKNIEEVVKGQPITIQLDREVDVSRGCVLAKDANITTCSTVQAEILWMDDHPLENGKNFFVKTGTKQIPGIVANILYSIDVNTGKKKKTHILHKNEIAVCVLSFTEPIIIDEFKKHKVLGELILIDRITNRTAACGVVKHRIHSDSVFSESVNKDVRAALKGQKALTYVFELNSDFSLSFIEAVEKQLTQQGRHIYTYIPGEHESYINVINHLNEAGLIVLLALNPEVSKETAIQSYCVVSGNKRITEVVDEIIKQSQFQIEIQEDDWVI